MIHIHYNKLKTNAVKVTQNDILETRDPHFATEIFINNVSKCIGRAKTKKIKFQTEKDGLQNKL